MPAVHRVASLLKRWLLGTHQGSVSAKHLDYYLDEFVFRFNRRTSKHRAQLFFRLMQQAVAIETTTYGNIVGRNEPTEPPGAKCRFAASLAQSPRRIFSSRRHRSGRVFSAGDGQKVPIQRTRLRSPGQGEQRLGSYEGTESLGAFPANYETRWLKRLPR